VKSVRFHDDARLEFIDKVAYYEDIQPGLGQRFRVRVEAAVALATSMPTIGFPYKYGTRRVFPRRFPYSVVYVEFEVEIVISCSGAFQAQTGLLAGPKE